MQYFLTRELGTAWSDSNSEFQGRWGASESQHRLAKNVRKGDCLLHFVNSVRSWVGYSTVMGGLQANTTDKHEDWRLALPFIIPIQKEVWLTEAQSQLTTEIKTLSHSNFHRPATFSRVLKNDGERVVQAIKQASNRSIELDPGFDLKWNEDAEVYYKGIVIALAKGCCQLCGSNAIRWASGVDFPLSDVEVEKLKISFLDAAHIIPQSEKGNMLADNLRALCPSCHRVVDRLSPSRRYELFSRVKLIPIK